MTRVGRRGGRHPRGAFGAEAARAVRARKAREALALVVGVACPLEGAVIRAREGPHDKQENPEGWPRCHHDGLRGLNFFLLARVLMIKRQKLCNELTRLKPILL